MVRGSVLALRTRSQQAVEAPPLIVVLGCPRTGTNMLRDALVRTVPGAWTWPGDEINPFWTWGHTDLGHDAIPVERATERDVARKRRWVARAARRSGCRVVVEKTCANTLRVPYVRAVFPRARFIVIERDPIDAVASAVARWGAPTPLAYRVQKGRQVPFSTLPRYVARTAAASTFARTRAAGRFWGPRWPGWERAALMNGPLELAMEQWVRGQVGLDDASRHGAVRTRYERFVREPAAELTRLADALGYPARPGDVDAAVVDVSRRSVGKGYEQLDKTQLAWVQERVAAHA